MITGVIISWKSETADLTKKNTKYSKRIPGKRNCIRFYYAECAEVQDLQDKSTGNRTDSERYLTRIDRMEQHKAPEG